MQIASERCSSFQNSILTSLILSLVGTLARSKYFLTVAKGTFAVSCISAEKSIAHVSDPIVGMPVVSTTVDRPTCVENAFSFTPSTVMVVLEGLAMLLSFFRSAGPRIFNSNQVPLTTKPWRETLPQFLGFLCGTARGVLFCQQRPTHVCNGWTCRQAGAERCGTRLVHLELA